MFNLRLGLMGSPMDSAYGAGSGPISDPTAFQGKYGSTSQLDSSGGIDAMSGIKYQNQQIRGMMNDPSGMGAPTGLGRVFGDGALLGSKTLNINYGD